MGLFTSNSFELNLPEWVDSVLENYNGNFRCHKSCMEFVIHLAKMNVEKNTGGPFGAAVVDRENGRVVAPGVNCVVQSNSSIAHAEILALTLAQRHLKVFSFSGKKFASLELITSCEPCAMCIGAIVWTGIQSVVCGARDEDVRKIGFDEGPKSPTWIAELSGRNILVYQDVCREQAVNVLSLYKAKGGLIYNG